MRLDAWNRDHDRLALFALLSMQGDAPLDIFISAQALHPSMIQRSIIHDRNLLIRFVIVF